MKVLKAIVAVMGLMIVTLMILIVYGFYQKTQDPDFKFFDLGSKKTAEAPPSLIPAPTPVPMPAIGGGPAFADIELEVRPGSTIVSASQANGNLIVILRDPGREGADQIAVIDLATGTVRGRIRLAP